MKRDPFQQSSVKFKNTVKTVKTVKDVKENDVVAGIPAKVIRKRRDDDRE